MKLLVCSFSNLTQSTYKLTQIEDISSIKEVKLRMQWKHLKKSYKRKPKFLPHEEKRYSSLLCSTHTTFPYLTPIRLEAALSGQFKSSQVLKW